jgi:hypothetical protein
MLGLFVEEKFHMQKNVKEQRNPFLRKIITVVFLPIIIFVWTTGLVLTIIGNQMEPTEIRQKTLQTYPKYEEETEAPDQESKISDKPQIIA